MDSLLLDLYAGVRDPHRLRTFIAGLTHELGCHTAALTRRDSSMRTGSAVEAVGSAVDAENIIRYESEFVGSSDNLWYERAKPIMRTGAVIVGDELATPEEVRKTRYFADFLRHIDTQHSAALCGVMEGSKVSILTLCRSASAGAFESGQISLLRKVAPHWENAYALLMRFEELEVSGRTNTPALVALDERFRWMSGNNAAFLLAKTGAWRGGPGQELEPINPASRAAWHAAAKGLAKHGAVAAMPVPIYGKTGQPLGFASLRPYGRFAEGQNLPHYVLTVHSISYGANAGMLQGLKAVFGLTPSEAALASALYETGDLAEAAAALKISVPSARTRLQAVFHKTGVRRQIELVRLLETLAASLE